MWADPASPPEALWVAMVMAAEAEPALSGASAKSV
jgi:hypothetical protein